MITVLTLNPSVDRSYVLEDFALGKVQRAKSVTATAGGKGLNVSRVISTLGGTVSCLGFLGGFTGGFIKQELAACNLIDCFTPIHGTTRICMNFRDDKGLSTEVLESGPDILPEELERFEQQLRRNIKRTKILVGSGSLAKGIPTDYYGKIARICKAAEVRFILDSSGESLRMAIKEQPFLVKPNEEELEYITGMKIKTVDDAFTSSSLLLQLGAENVCVSMGRSGMILNGSLGQFVVRVPNIAVTNTVGCGDSLVSGLAYALYKNYKVAEVLKFANACALSNAVHSGVGQVNAEQVKRFTKEVHVQAYVSKKTNRIMVQCPLK
ncbi:hypothetical protein P22_1065 [Propionispora sp. 2/2-37]|uniref:1-phosphofructokinase family hexose kinase n=1 Tax=Propionispora sp. 2/2-37 TaxID=1677858 RepID=UPI0006BB7A45|nr:1-phosphofructokinase family hexose kinase [Propionispora sp. 2/2-37]CUH94996.1 hypothetical protein P22_1065 [Propionispora sp. 2/2-37]